MVFRRLLREPLVQFLLLGAALFALSSLLAGRRLGKERIVVSRGQIESLAAMFERTWMRPPTAGELDGLVREHLREEVAYREALAMGLERDDTVIRRRLRQKLEFLSEQVLHAEPSEAELGAYLAAHPDAFRQEGSVSFSQVFLDPERRGDALERDTARLLADLRRAGAAADPRATGDPTLLEPEMTAATPSEVTGSFGPEFAQRLAALPAGEWQGPVLSTYGVHLVLVRERSDGRLPPLDEVRAAVRREWQNARRLEAIDGFYQGLLQRYAVTVEKVGAPAEAPAGGAR